MEMTWAAKEDLNRIPETLQTSTCRLSRLFILRNVIGPGSGPLFLPALYIFHIYDGKKLKLIKKKLIDDYNVHNDSPAVCCII
jgi:hypothetical protein